MNIKDCNDPEVLHKHIELLNALCTGLRNELDSEVSYSNVESGRASRLGTGLREVQKYNDGITAELDEAMQRLVVAWEDGAITQEELDGLQEAHDKKERSLKDARAKAKKKSAERRASFEAFVPEFQKMKQVYQRGGMSLPAARQYARLSIKEKMQEKLDDVPGDKMMLAMFK